MDSVTLILPVIAFNVLVLVPLANCWLDSCPDPSIWDQRVNGFIIYDMGCI